ncbi:MAG TPA: FISUMP domain-containing protein [Bacteroidales bacterium]|nr:FISUMP domain-containing protein [Bacteroidales bacterium]HRZ47868.1 FISUMP domain-containing protein [Bacteroidales bacterium]
MKKLMVISSLLIGFFNDPSLLIAQPYQITFTGSGLSSVVSTVKVQNLTQGTTLTLNGADILELVTSIGVVEISGSSEERGLKIYPNPVAGECLIAFENPQAGRVSIDITNLAGQLVIREEAYMQQGIQTFSAGGLQQGLYTVRVKTSCKQSTDRLISLSTSTDQPYFRQGQIGSINSPHAKLFGTIQMQYNAGERLLLKGISGNYSRVVTLVPTQSQTLDFNFIGCTDGDGNHYPVVTIGAQTWMAENLNTTRHSNGWVIPNITDIATFVNLTSSARCYYNNDSISYSATYGALYNWYAVDTGYLCPVGWHVPSDAEWTVLYNQLGGELVAGGEMKSTSLWNSPNTGATNSSGFSALPGGGLYCAGASFNDFGNQGRWRTSTIYDNIDAWVIALFHDGVQIDLEKRAKKSGFSVRCLKD